MYPLACGAVAGCHCWVPLLGPLLGIGGGLGVQVGGLDVVTLLGAIAGLPLLGAIAGCHCWLPLLGIGVVGVHVGGLDVVPLLAAIAGLPLLGIGGGGCTSWRIGCGDVAGCRCWVPLLGAIAGLPLLGAIAGWHCRCWLPLLGGMWSGAMVRCHCWVPCGKVPLLGAIAGCNRR